VSGDPIGGRVKVVLNAVEIRQTVWRSLSVAGFVDVGQVWSDLEAFGWDDPRWGAGVGLRLSTVLGVFRLDYGWKIPPQGEEKPGALYFSVGHAF
jgi:outer membrane protein insertion porin family